MGDEMGNFKMSMGFLCAVRTTSIKKNLEVPLAGMISIAIWISNTLTGFPEPL